MPVAHGHQRPENAMAAVVLCEAFLQPNAEDAHKTFGHVTDQMRDRWPKRAAFMDASEHDVLAYIGFPVQHRTKLQSTNTPNG
jgi:putative transposase